MERDQEGARRVFDRTAQRLMGISGPEFVRRWKSGEFQNPNHPQYANIQRLMPYLPRLTPPNPHDIWLGDHKR